MKITVSLLCALILSSSALHAGVEVDLGKIKIGDNITINSDEKEKKKNSGKNKGNNGKSEYAPGHQGKSSNNDGVTIKVGK